MLRALCRAADGQVGFADDRDDDTVSLPLGLVALNWLRLYLPLIRAGFPQTPNNTGAEGLGFAGQGFRALLKGLVPPLALRVGAWFSGEPAQVVRAAFSRMITYSVFRLNVRCRGMTSGTRGSFFSQSGAFMNSPIKIAQEGRERENDLLQVDEARLARGIHYSTYPIGCDMQRLRG